MRTVSVLWPLVCLTACSGPSAPDAAVCQDVVNRLCQTATCPGVGPQLAPGSDCQFSLEERTGCGAEDFAFTAPSRERFLDCRELLLSNGTTTETPTSCDDAVRFLNQCQDVAGFFREEGGQP
ncbi:hypothetical protein [Pyxidicoccus sp. MSG2]|uniref:hypothetical protein n=1 Tax=Pyxidicoccus sp. MSG2 TaxID=2996790 RepID=UPI00226EDBAE|nr:hypothetical protein [Pyxidicoccus sp. MSG2]MCY1016709.1 hypothetical protein [Pyxidicoccus sp. MSG2]